jgi:prolipoprotein diacylglyceryltransferase
VAPTIFGYSSYIVAMFVAVCLGNATLVVSAFLYRLSVARFLALGVSLSAVMLLGAKMYAVVERAVASVPFDPMWVEGYRQPGVLLAVVALPLAARRLMPRNTLGNVADALVLPAAVGLASFRAACLLRGCCFGTITLGWWAMRFPMGSPAWRHHESLGFIHGYEDWSLPVHPLQLLLSAAVLMSAGTALVLRRVGLLRAGQAFVVFVLLNQTSKCLMEFLRATPRSGGTTVQVADGIIALAAFVALLITSCRLRRGGRVDAARVT